MSDEWTKMDAKENSKTWDFKTEKEIVGTYVRKRENIGPKMLVMYILRLSDGTEKGVWENKIIKQKMDEVSIGSDVKIVYMGTVKAKTGGFSYNNFEFFTRKPKTQPAQTDDTIVLSDEDHPF